MPRGELKRVELVWPVELVAAIDRAADARPRSVWLRRVAEKALGDAYRPVSGGSEERVAGAAEVADAPAPSRSPSHPLSEKEKQGIRNIAGRGSPSPSLERFKT